MTDNSSTKASSQVVPEYSREPTFRLPGPVRAFVRTRESALVLTALLIGIGGGLLVRFIAATTQRIHELLFGLERGTPLSLAHYDEIWRPVLVVAMGGAALGLLQLCIGDALKDAQVDAIEANALRGGRMSAIGSVYITFQTMLSNGFGASVGLEAAYTQICGAISSALGLSLGVRRSDMRLLVGCGAAAAIAGVFEAPLAGAFYAFEVVLGFYSVRALAPVATSALAASFVAEYVSGRHLVLAPGAPGALGGGILFHLAAVAVLCSGTSILLMGAVAGGERIFKKLRVASWLRPTIGGALVGSIAIVSPQVLGAGHGAFAEVLTSHSPATVLLAIAGMKFAASAISLGAGFRGGLFFASMLIGALIGRAYALLVMTMAPGFGGDPTSMALVGMAAFGTGIVGSPVTMTCLALELTGDFSVTAPAIIACVATALVVRRTFGYSFATWRFHLRGETIRGPYDVGWVRDLNVARLLRRDLQTHDARMSIAECRAAVPIESAKEFAVVDGTGRYAGMILVSDLHATTLDPKAPVKAIAQSQDDYLLPAMNIRQALDLFEDHETDVLPVLDSAEDRKIIGRVSEAYALRRYGEALERRNREVLEH